MYFEFLQNNYTRITRIKNDFYDKKLPLSLTEKYVLALSLWYNLEKIKR